VSAGQDARSERPAMGRGQPRPAKRSRFTYEPYTKWETGDAGPAAVPREQAEWKTKRLPPREERQPKKPFGGLHQRQARRLAAIGAALRYSQLAALDHLLSREEPQPSRSLRDRRRASNSPAVAGERRDHCRGSSETVCKRSAADSPLPPRGGRAAVTCRGRASSRPSRPSASRPRPPRRRRS
jgi:hypothetical protein